jgi:putative hydrolase of the HAD superfamily
VKDSQNQIQAVLFDLGETLLNFGRFNHIQLFRQGAKLSYDYLVSLHQTVENFEYYYWRNLISLLYNRLASRFRQEDFNSLSLLRKVGTTRGYNLDSSQWRQYAWSWYEPLKNIATTESDLKQTLIRLKNLGLKLGIVSNTFVNADTLDRHLEQLGILDFFEVRIYSYRFSFRKPDTRMFSMAADKISVAMQNILFVGDRIEKDIIPALKLGMHPVLKAAYYNEGRLIPPGARKISQLSELPGIIEEINASGFKAQDFSRNS